jgi:hypothetical protein
MTIRLFKLEQTAAVLFTILLLLSRSSAQFIDDFIGLLMTRDSSGANGWTYYAGEGYGLECSQRPKVCTACRRLRPGVRCSKARESPSQCPKARNFHTHFMEFDILDTLN